MVVQNLFSLKILKSEGLHAHVKHSFYRLLRNDTDEFTTCALATTKSLTPFIRQYPNTQNADKSAYIRSAGIEISPKPIAL